MTNDAEQITEIQTVFITRWRENPWSVVKSDMSLRKKSCDLNLKHVVYLPDWWSAYDSWLRRCDYKWKLYVMIGDKLVGSVDQTPLKPKPFPKRLWWVLPGWKLVLTFTSPGRWDIFVHNAAWVTSEEDEWVRRETAKIRGGSSYVFSSSAEFFFIFIVWGLESLSFPRVPPSLCVSAPSAAFSSCARPFPLYHFFLILLANLLLKKGEKI